MYFQFGGAIIFPLLLAGNAWGQGNVTPLPLNVPASLGSTSGPVSSSSISMPNALPTPPQNIVLQDYDDDDDDDDDEAQISTTQPLVTVSTTNLNGSTTASISLPVSGSGTGVAAPTGPAIGAPFSNTTSAVQTSAVSQNSGAVPIVTGIGIGTAPGFGTGTGGAGPTGPAIGAPFSNTTSAVQTSAVSQNSGAVPIVTGIGIGTAPGFGTGTGGAGPTGPAIGAPFSNTTSAVQTSAVSQNSGAVPIVTGIGIGTAPGFGTGTGGAGPTGPAIGAPFSNTTSAVQTSAVSQNSGAVPIVTGIGIGTAPGFGTGTGGPGLPIPSINPPFGNNTATTAGSSTGTKTFTTILQTSTVVSVSGGQTITKEVVNTVVQEATITEVGAATTTGSTIATETGTVTSPIIIIVQQVTLFVFNSALGCLPPAVVPNTNVPGSFIVGLQPFSNLPAACSAACNQQLSFCVSVAGPAFPVVACQIQFTACINAAQQASTVTQIAGVPVPSTINQTVVLPPQAVTSNTIGNMISNAGGSIITTETLSASAVATVGNGGVSIITPTQTSPVQMTPILTNIIQTLPAETTITTSIVTVTIGDDDDDEPKVQVVTRTVTAVSPPRVTTIAANVLAPQVSGDITGVAASNVATDAANPVTDTMVTVGVPATVTETLTMTVIVSDCASTVTLATCPGSSPSSLPSLSSASYLSPSLSSNSASDTLTTVTISTASATPTTPSGDDDDDESQNGFRSAVRSLLGKRTGPSRSRIMRGRA